MAKVDPQLPLTGPLHTLDLVRERVVQSMLSRAAINHPGLAAEVRRQFSSREVEAGAVMREPVIEGAAPFEIDGRTFADCSGSLLHPEVIRAISGPDAEPYRFPPEAQPYRHQIAAWEHLIAPEPRSVLVSSGTGSGKTECFLMPLLHDLACESERHGRLSGVRAIALYPLNALIASQEERLRAWTAPFGGRIRFGLYNGLTPERPDRHAPVRPEQVTDRETLRTDPPPILVTNVTMLEYMMVRRIDRPLIENSRGTLRWIILDEAHGYVGSAAAEIALLIRRVLLTFGVKPEDVRFVATSATIGSGRDVTEELQRFLRDLTGTPGDRVHVVIGHREAVHLPSPAPDPWLPAASLSDREALRANPAVQSFVRAAEKGPVLLEQATRMLAPTGLPADSLICAIADDSDKQRGPLLPLRVHGFLRAVPGLWSCLNPECAESPTDWPFGKVLAERVEACPCCGAPVLEILSCRECGEPYLDCEEDAGRLRPRITPPPIDEFAELREAASGSETDGEADADAHVPGDEDVQEGPLYPVRRRSIALRGMDGYRLLHIDPATGAVIDAPQDETISLYAGQPDRCGACNGQDGQKGSILILRPFRFGAPFLIGNAAPVLLEGLPARQPAEGASFSPPAGGRQLLSFTDSRQGTARFAANLQTASERSFVRSFLYHAVQGSIAAQGADNPEAKALAAEIAQLETAAPEALAGLIAQKKAQLAELTQPSFAGIAWSDMRSRLAGTVEARKWMRDVWQLRDSRFRNDTAAFAQFLLLRELARRPRRANTAETLGLVRLHFPAIERIRSLPEPLATAGYALSHWHDLLHVIIDMVARANLAVRIDDADLHWITSKGWRKELLPFGQAKQVQSEIAWPRAGGSGAGNLVLILEKALRVDRSEPQGRALINEVLEQAWTALSALFSDPTQPGYALSFDKAHIAPVTKAYLCPVSRRILARTALGLSPYGHREHLRMADAEPLPIDLPSLPITFTQDESARSIIQDWLASDQVVTTLRNQGVWTDLQDRAALLSPYIRAAEHSAQQPPARLRRFEDEFKAGEINILNCSTTMEMGVDIGSVSAVMMTNVPPALANYRQRVGRAGRRKQGFATSLTYTRDTPLEREAFRDPETYLKRETRAPQVRLDSRRIVQRHVNALLLARWFAGEGGEALKARTGDFFGCPEGIGADRPEHPPVEACLAWLRAPETELALVGEVSELVRSTVLALDGTLFATAAEALTAARDAVIREWQELQYQAAAAPEAGRKALGYQLQRLARENLMSELAVRAVLPSHSMPTGVVSFVNTDKPGADETATDDTSFRRRSFPTRTLDIAIRDYAPGAEVVIDGLVYRSAGVTLNWKRPADHADAHEAQALRDFWTCPACGAADCSSVAPSNCPACRAEIPLAARRSFLQPAGFTADMNARPHAETEEVTWVAPEREQIIVRGASWQPMADPSQGRMRATSDGLVFYSSRGPGQQGYHVCLECGRAEPAARGSDVEGRRPLEGHLPLRGSRNGVPCPGNDSPLWITPAISLGCETLTDVVELQPANLPSEGAACALVSALREALARRLGVETGEMGMAVQRAVGPLGQLTHSLFLFDRASGGAGFAPQAASMFEVLITDARNILDCPEPGCQTGCSACVLSADLFQQQEQIDRKGALAWVLSATRAFGNLPAEDRIHPEARLSRSVLDELATRVDGGARDVFLWIDGQADIASLAEPGFSRFLRRLGERGAQLRLIVDPAWLQSLDAAARLGLRDIAKMLGLDLRKGKRPTFDNGAGTLAMAIGENLSEAWASRDILAGIPGESWGRGHTAAVVRLPSGSPPLAAPIELDSLLPPSGTVYIEVKSEFDGPLVDFAKAFTAKILPAVRALVPKAALTAIRYNDRYLQSPLTLRLMADVLAAFRDALAGSQIALPLAIVTNSHKANERQPYLFSHDWAWAEDRDAVLQYLVQARRMELELALNGAAHGRQIDLTFDDDSRIRIVLDQGFGPWRCPPFARFDFADDAASQALRIDKTNVMIAAQGPTYIVVTSA
ncbi:DEAD/DEAH box helicase [Erythrobacter cryptus]|uniref:DEAD/DEAH box helicase n=1 Tax=Erythrobacter cryptus TaxID=196588 RepID=UPI000429E33E|nr:DEAD/DEAH box helicase [Erythrobacter cryptus]